MRLLLVGLLLLSLSSCGYRFGRGEVIDRYCSVCVPYAEGDDRGLFTNALVHAVTTKGALVYRSYGAQLRLNVCLFAPDDENIGFSYAPAPDDKVVVSDEARLSLTARVQLIDRCTGQCVIEPFIVTSSISYDFEPDLTNINQHAFSLGQLEMHNLAQDAVFSPLYQLLAEKIVDYVNHAW